MTPLERLLESVDYATLTELEQLFLAEYLENGGNGRAAVAKAYPNIQEKGRGPYASKLLRRPHIQSLLSYARTGESVSKELFWARLRDMLLTGTPSQSTAALRLIAEIWGLVKVPAVGKKTEAAPVNDNFEEVLAERLNKLPLGKILEKLPDGRHIEAEG